MKWDMTKVVEEIVTQCKETEEEFIFETIHPYCENILQMKINKEELKQILLNGMQKQQPCEDCISREEAIKEFQPYREYSSNRTNNEWVDRIEDVLKLLPPVTPQKSKGKWILDNNGWDTICNCCGQGEWHGYIPTPEIATKWMPICPKCGAKMGEDNEDNN